MIGITMIFIGCIGPFWDWSLLGWSLLGWSLLAWSLLGWSLLVKFLVPFGLVPYGRSLLAGPFWFGPFRPPVILSLASTSTSKNPVGLTLVHCNHLCNLPMCLTYIISSIKSIKVFVCWKRWVEIAKSHHKNWPGNTLHQHNNKIFIIYTKSCHFKSNQGLTVIIEFSLSLLDLCT